MYSNTSLSSLRIPFSSSSSRVTITCFPKPRCRDFGLGSGKPFCLAYQRLTTRNITNRAQPSLKRVRLLSPISHSNQHVCFTRSGITGSCQQLSWIHESSQSHPGDLPPYSTPITGFLSYLPASWVPFAELARLDKPAGSYYLFFPCVFSTLLAGGYTGAELVSVISATTLFASGALIMRGAGCTINDLWDRNLDPYVTRTRLRPLARKAVSPFAATVFFGAQCLAGLGILVQFPQQCLLWGIPSLLLVATYPLAKRVTHYPQLVLGLTFSWGAIMGFPALGVDVLADQAVQLATGLLYASCVSWTVLYDMIYAHMDIKDDKFAGIKSIALKHEHETKNVLTGLAIIQLALLAGSGMTAGAGPAFFLLSCGGAAGTLGTMIYRVQLQSVTNCWWWFKYGSWFTGGTISLGLFVDYLTKQPKGLVDHVEQESSLEGEIIANQVRK